MTSAIKAVVRYELAARAVRELTWRIGNALRACDISGLANESEHPGQDTAALWTDDGKIKTHLWQAFKETTDSDYPYPPSRKLDDGEISDYLAEQGCQHCAEAWRLVLERKAARSAFGVAKRAIRAIARAEISRQGAP